MCHQKCTCPQLPLLLWLISRFAVEVSLLSVRAHRLTATWQTWHSASRTVLMNHSYGWVSRRDSQGIFWAKQSKTAICLLLVQSLENTIVSTFPSIATILSLPYLYNLPWPCTYVLSHTHTPSLPPPPTHHTYTHARARARSQPCSFSFTFPASYILFSSFLSFLFPLGFSASRYSYGIYAEGVSECPLPSTWLRIWTPILSLTLSCIGIVHYFYG